MCYSTCQAQKMTNSRRFYRISNSNGSQDGDQKSGDVTASGSATTDKVFLVL